MNLFSFHSNPSSLEYWDRPYQEMDDGSLCWYKNGRLHRDGDLPAEDNEYVRKWCKDGLYHRDGAPAVVFDHGKSYYYKHGEPHRVDGPAVIAGDDHWADDWWYEGNHVGVIYAKSTGGGPARPAFHLHRTKFREVMEPAIRRYYHGHNVDLSELDG